MSTNQQVLDNSVATQFVTFKVGRLLFGINVMQVQEVLHYEEATSVPLTSSEVAGLINLRGLIITAIDLGAYLDYTPSAKAENNKIVVVNTANETLGLVVHQIGEVIEVTNNSYESIPSTLDLKCKNITNGIYKLTNALLLELNINYLFNTGERTTKELI